FRNPKVSLRVRLCDLLGHLQRSGERDCQEFYRALYIHAQPLHSCLPSRHALQQTYCDRLVQDTPFLTGLGRLSEQQVDRIILQLNRYYPQILSNKDAEKGVSLSSRPPDPSPPFRARGAAHVHFSPGPVAFLTCLGLAAGLALLIYCCPPDPKVLPGARRVLGFSPVIIDRHVSRFLLAFLTDDLGGL
ncbi:CARD19, partial [Cervus elaphus hippelaphus]